MFGPQDPQKKHRKSWKVEPSMPVLGLCETALEQAIFGLQRHGIFQVPHLGRDGNRSSGVPWSSLVPKKGPRPRTFFQQKGRLKNTNASTRSCEITLRKLGCQGLQYVECSLMEETSCRANPSPLLT